MNEEEIKDENTPSEDTPQVPKYTIILRHDESTNWTLNNPILQFGEYGVEDDTHRIKRGDGKTNWIALPYETFGIRDLTYTFKEIKGSVEDNEQLKSIFENLIEVIDTLQDTVKSLDSRVEALEGEKEPEQPFSCNLKIKFDENQTQSKVLVITNKTTNKTDTKRIDANVFEYTQQITEPGTYNINASIPLGKTPFNKDVVVEATQTEDVVVEIPLMVMGSGPSEGGDTPGSGGDTPSEPEKASVLVTCYSLIDGTEQKLTNSQYRLEVTNEDGEVQESIAAPDNATLLDLYKGKYIFKATNSSTNTTATQTVEVTQEDVDKSTNNSTTWKQVKMIIEEDPEPGIPGSGGGTGGGQESGT